MVENHEISLLQIIYKVKKGVLFIFAKWRVVLVVTLLFAIIGGIYFGVKKPEYEANVTLMLESGRSGGMGLPYLQLVSDMGFFNLPSLNEGKFIDLVKSRSIIGGALLKRGVIGEKDDLLANHQIDFMELQEEWQDDEELMNFKFSNDDVTQFDNNENKVLSLLCSFVVGEFLEVESLKSGIISITIKSESELFSKYFSENLVEGVSDFYVNNIIEKEKNTVRIIQSEVDSIEALLKITELEYAKWEDESHHMIKAQGHLEKVKFLTDLELLKALYIESQKNLALSKFNLLHKTPIVQIIDNPTLPLKKSRRSTMFGIILGGLFGGGFICVILLLTKALAGSLKEDEQNTEPL